MNVLILGGGPAGCAAAYYLIRIGVTDVAIVEHAQLGGLCKTRFYENIPYEYGPQIMYTDEVQIQAVFEKYVTKNPPPTTDGRYYPALSIDGDISANSIHSFPVIFENILKLPDPAKVIEELYHVNLTQPDFSNFENYVISRMGPTLYDIYIKNYNIKQWKIHPKDMDAEWAKFRPMTLHKSKTGMFKSNWQGHPGDYNPMWSGMTLGAKIIKGTACLSENFSHIEINGDTVDADLIISTLPLSKELDFINTCLVYVVLKSEETVMPSYATSFPNTYDFVRVMEYRQQFHVQSSYTLLDFQFSFTNQCDTDSFIAQVRHFVETKLHRPIVELWTETRKDVYPVSTKRNLEIVRRQLHYAASSNIVPIGRSGMHAYVSKDTCIRMAQIMSENLDAIISGNSEKKMNVLQEMRGKLT